MVSDCPSPDIQVTFQPDGVTVCVPPGTELQDAIVQAGVDIEHPCGGKGICEKCRVEIDGEVSPPTELEQNLFSQDLLNRGRRLSCQVKIFGPLTVRRVESAQSAEVILQQGEEPDYKIDPPIRASHLTLDSPSVSDQRSDEERLFDAVQAAHHPLEPIPPHILSTLPEVVRKEQWSVTAVLRNREWLTVQPGDRTSQTFGVAVDLGTTTVVASLHELPSGKEIAKQGLTNKQTVCGSDVISRMTYLQSGDHRKRLSKYATDTINELIVRLSDESGIQQTDICEVAVVGNTIMQQLLLNVDPLPIGETPFVPAFRRPTVWSARKSMIEVHPDACLCLAPVIAGYVGGDIVADILATSVYESEKPVLLVDLGTNAEVVLADRHRICACACAAGPAFEGGEISQGIRAVPGAIEKVTLEGERLGIGVIGNIDPTGICGSGLVDALAVLLDIGAVTSAGRLLPREEFSGPDWVRERILNRADGVAFELWKGQKESIYLTEKDIREIQLAKGAVKAGIKILCHQHGVSPLDVEKVLIAGAFGSHLNPKSALKTGLIPPLPPEKVFFVGNTAWVGAKMMLLSTSVERQIRAIMRHAQYLELSGRMDFQEEFALSMPFDSNWVYVQEA